LDFDHLQRRDSDWEIGFGGEEEKIGVRGIGHVFVSSKLSLEDLVGRGGKPYQARVEVHDNL
jgi:hypothetical protein